MQTIKDTNEDDTFRVTPENMQISDTVSILVSKFCSLSTALGIFFLMEC